ncbi:porin [Mesosutterella sp. AGMB02718]|uniref:Porin n=1 Tax=Mesosutterella faecium TaxID=2925194 RepID=A0ABT7IPG0_9BURK|nr:porin [Mesosutterella sp. AGMB02718]MDL2059778.1 porin [Mesosutterella sp. AGMB02718]
MSLKTLLAASLLSLFSASVLAVPTVTLYGKIDTSILYTHRDMDNGTDSTDTVSMESGYNLGSRWGLRGTEKIGNVNVGFVLESGIGSDDGTAWQSGRLFGREAQIHVSGSYGTLYAGRLATIAGDLGSIQMLYPVDSAFGNGLVEGVRQGGSTGLSYGRYDNTLAYMSPTLNGFRAGVMYSFKADQKADATTRENSGNAKRYAAGALQYTGANFGLVLAGDYTMYSNAVNPGVDDGYNILLGGNYNFGPVQLFAKATYFDNVLDELDTFSVIPSSMPLEGWGAELSAKIPAFGGSFKAAVGYRSAKDVNDSSNKFKRFNVGGAYEYPFSKRTFVYVSAGYAQEKVKSSSGDYTPNEFQAVLGVNHSF